MTTDRPIDNKMTDPQLAFEIRRALLEDVPVPDTEAAFLKLQNQLASHGKTSQHTKLRQHARQRRIFFSATLLTAACLAALFILLMGRNTSSTATQRVPGLLVYDAKPQTVREISISCRDEKLNINKTQTHQQGFTFSADNVISVQRTTDEELNTETTLFIPTGKVAQVILEDGTHVWLSANSQLKFPHNFAANEPRIVKLTGEAYFEVKHDAARPFIVDCDKFNTTVLGTEFNVRNVQGLPPEVALVNGSIRLNSHNRQVILSPSEGATITADGNVNVSNIDTDVVTSWKDGEFYFDGQTLREIMTEIGRWYNMDVVFENNKHQYNQLHFNGERDWNITETVHQLRMITAADIQIKDNTIVVK